MDLKFRIKNKEHSKDVQKRLFGMGFTWAGSETGVSNIEMPGLYTDTSDMTITYTDKTINFDDEPEHEALLVHPIQLEFLKKLFNPNEIVLDILDTKFYLKRDTPYLNKLLTQSK